MDLSLVDLGSEVIRTDRLVLRPFRPTDEDAILRACQDSEIQRWISVIPGSASRAARSATSIASRWTPTRPCC